MKWDCIVLRRKVGDFSFNEDKDGGPKKECIS